MADEKVTALVEETVPLTSDLLYLVDDPAGAPISKKATVINIVDAGLKSVQSSANLIKNSPGQIVVDGAEPQWWDDVANATITDEDTAGEAPLDIHARCFKVVTIANDVYGYQIFTFADEDLLDAGTTEVSLSCWVYCATGSKASIGIFGTNLTLQESSQAGAGAWELLTVENITLDAADAGIEIRLIVDTDTAWFTMPMLNVGAVAMPWRQRGWRFVRIATQAKAIDQNPVGDIAWTDQDCTAVSDPLAVAIVGHGRLLEPNGNIGSYLQVGHAGALVTADYAVIAMNSIVLNHANYGHGMVMCDDGQLIRYTVYEADADSDCNAAFWIDGYWMWE